MLKAATIPCICSWDRPFECTLFPYNQGFPRLLAQHPRMVARQMQASGAFNLQTSGKIPPIRALSKKFKDLGRNLLKHKAKVVFGFGLPTGWSCSWRRRWRLVWCGCWRRGRSATRNDAFSYTLCEDQLAGAVDRDPKLARPPGNTLLIRSTTR